MRETDETAEKIALSGQDRLFLSRTSEALAAYLAECGGLPRAGRADTEELRELAKAKLAEKRKLAAALGSALLPNAEAVVTVGEGERECLVLAAILLCMTARLRKSPYASCPTAAFILVPPGEDAELCGALGALCGYARSFSPRLSAAVSEKADGLPIAAAELFFPENRRARELALCGAIPILPEEAEEDGELMNALAQLTDGTLSARFPALRERLEAMPELPSLLAGWETLASESGSLRFWRLSLASIAAAAE